MFVDGFSARSNHMPKNHSDRNSVSEAPGDRRVTFPEWTASMSAFDFLDGLTGAPVAPPSSATTSSGFAFLTQPQPTSTPPKQPAVDIFGGLQTAAPAPVARSGGSGLDDALSAFGLAPATRDAPLPQMPAASTSGASAAPPDFATASASQLKRFLDARGVDHRSCVEKSELLALARKTAGVADGPSSSAPSSQPRSTALVQGLGNAFALHGMTHLAPEVAASLDHELEVRDGIAPATKECDL